MNRRSDIEVRLHLARANESLISVAISNAVASRADTHELAAVITDTRDPLARKLTAALLERSSDLDLLKEERRTLGRGMIPTGLAVLPLQTAVLLLSQTHPQIAEGLRIAPSSEKVRVVVIASGGASLLHLPVRPLPRAGSA